MPEGFGLKIADSDGRLIASIPEKWEEPEEKSKGYVINARIDMQGAEASLYIPRSYFSGMLFPAYRFGFGMLGLVAAVGLLLCVLFSNLSTKPVRRLASLYREKTKLPKSGDEVAYLESIIGNAWEERNRLRRRLTSTNLVRALSGETLSIEEEEQLSQNVPLLGGQYQAAIVHTSEKINEILKPALLKELSEDFLCEIINSRETGILFPGEEEKERHLCGVLEKMKEKLAGEHETLFCGISTVKKGIGELCSAVLQANAAIPAKSGIARFCGESHGKMFPVLLYERLKQCILTNEERNALELLEEISKEVSRGGMALEMFYSICFILRSASAEMGLFLPELREVRYREDGLPAENIMQLRKVILLLFDQIRDRQEGRLKEREEELLIWIEENCQKADLSAGLAAAVYGVSEKWVYTAVRRAKNMSFSEYLTMLRMKRASSLLCTTNRSIREIAEMCGYPAKSTFYRIFTGYFHISPTEYRKRGGG